MSISIAQLHEFDELDAFLASHNHSSLYLRAELRREWSRPEFAIARVDGAIVAAATQSLTGMVLLQTPVSAGAVAAAMLRHSKRRLTGFFGPLAQVQAARREMGLDTVEVRKDTSEHLFALALASLHLPSALASGKVRCRSAVKADFDQLAAWRHDFRVATLNDIPGQQLEKTSRGDIASLLASSSLFILEGDAPLACCSFNARLPDIVQIGNVWTPPPLRGLGYGRAVVAGALSIARESGVVEAILATGRHNVAAQAAYKAIGFTLVGDYATLTIGSDTVLPSF